MPHLLSLEFYVLPLQTSYCSQKNQFLLKNPNEERSSCAAARRRSSFPAMAALRRAISAAAAAGRYGLSRQDALHTSTATLHRALASPSAARKLGLGAPGLKVCSMSTVPKWMSDHHKKVAVDPDLAFHNLRADAKDFVVLMHLSDQTSRVIQRNDDSVQLVLVELAKLYDKQVHLEQGIWALVLVLVGSVGSLAYFGMDVRDKAINVR